MPSLKVWHIDIISYHGEFSKLPKCLVLLPLNVILYPLSPKPPPLPSHFHCEHENLLIFNVFNELCFKYIHYKGFSLF